MYRLTSVALSNLQLSRQKCVSQVRQLSNKVLGKEQQPELKDQPVEGKSTGYETMKISTKIQKKLPAREPLLKNLVIGKVDTTMMAFPEVIQRDDMQKLQGEIQGIQKYFQEQLDIGKIRATQAVGQEEKAELINLGLYGVNIPQQFGGWGCTYSESLIATESETVSTDISTMLVSHRLVVDVIQKYGTQEQMERFLPILASGAGAATEAVYERGVPREGIFHTKATYDEFDKKWVLKGEKSFVANGKDANFFLVVAETEKLNIAGDKALGATLFMVDGASAGLKRRSDQFPLGCKGSEFSTITFDGVKLDENCVIGDVNLGTEIAFNLLEFQRLRMSLVTSGLMKSLVSHLSEHCITTKQGAVAVKDMENAGLRLSRLVCKTYALEAMVYYIAGLMDEFDNQDVTLEVAATKLYSLECLQDAARAPLDFMGPVSLLSDQPTHEFVTNAIQLSTHGESKDSLILYTGLLGLQHAGMNINETIKKERNPLMHPAYMLGKLFQNRTLDDPKLNLRLNEELHPSLEIPSKLLEQSIARIKMSIEMLLIRNGAEVIQKHIDIARIAEMTSLVFAMFATLSRASRSHCIGLRHSDYELVLSITICADASNRVKQLASEIANGPYANNDRNHLKIAKQIFKSNGFFLQHPTTYNF